MSLNNRICHGFLKSVDTTGKSASFENLQTFVWPSAEPLHPYRKPLHSRDQLEVRCVQNIRQNIRPLADLSVPAEFHLWSFTISFKAFSMRPCRGQPKKSEREEKSTLFPRLVISHHSSISKRMKQSRGTAIMPRGRQG